LNSSKSNSPSFNTEKRKGLYVITRFEKGFGQHYRSDHRTLSPTAVKTNFIHDLCYPALSVNGSRSKTR
jgi:hypothetical protein